jgi:hypothetical protein
MSLALNNVDNFLRVPLLLVLVDQVGLSALLAQAVAVAVGFALRFTVLSRVVYRVRRLPEAPHQEAEAPTVRAA